MRCAIFIAAVCIVGCGKSTAVKTKQVIPMDKVPPVVMKAAQTKEPEVKFVKVIADGGIYEVQGKTNTGKIVEVEVSEAGQVLKVE